jgi:MarR family transcriptional regulator, organic hydroperoxide resistance regulator
MVEKTKGGFLISRVKQVQDRIFDRLLKEEGIADLNGPQGRILFVLWQHDDLPISELGQRTSLSKSALTSMLDRMEAHGYLRRSYDPADRRQIRITLTDEARAQSGRYLRVSARMNAIFYRGFSDREIGEFEGQLERVLGNLKQYEEEG